MSTLHNQKRDNNKFKNKNNQNGQKVKLYGKSNNQGVREETFIQTSKRDGDGQQRQRGFMARQQQVDWVGDAAAGKLGGPTFVCG